VAARLKQEADVEVEVIDGGEGEFSVYVDGRLVAQKGATAPTDDEVVEAVHNAGGVPTA
jgi:hypothetical protein